MERDFKINLNELIESLNERASNFRNQFNKPRRKNILLEDMDKWHQLCSSADIIEDSNLAFYEYVKILEIESNFEYPYLIIYGTLQSIFLQQDALINIGTALNIETKLPEKLKEIREVRNNVAGHPIREYKGKLKSFHFLVRASSSISNFSLLSNEAGKSESKFEYYSLPDLIKYQLTYSNEILESFINKLINENEEHKLMHKNKVLSEMLLPVLGYSSNKVYECFFGSFPLKFAETHIENIKITLENIKAELIIRNIFSNSGLEYAIKEIDYPLKKMESHLKHNDQSWNNQDAIIYYSYIDNKLKEIKEMCKSVDEDYLV